MKLEEVKNKINHVAIAAQIAAILEVTAKKPGNVSPVNDFDDTTYEDFLVGSLAMGAGIRESAKRGFLSGERKFSLAEIKIGELIKRGVTDVKSSHPGGNSHLGIIMLMVPIGAGFGIGIAQGDITKLRENIGKVIENSTIEDSLNFYEAIKIAKAGGFQGELREPRVNFYKLMGMSSGGDRIAEELSNSLKITFQTSQFLEKNFKKTKQIRKAITQTYLQILAEFLDTLIAKKAGQEKAQEISRRAKEIVNVGGVFSQEGKNRLERFGQELSDEKNRLNPGTTADIIAAGIMLWLLKEKFKYNLKF